MEKEIKHIRGLASVLNVLAKEIKKKGYFESDDLDLLKKVGSDLVFKGCALSYTHDIKKSK